MSHPVFRQIAFSATILAWINSIAGPTILLCSWLGMSGMPIAFAATTVMILTLALQVAFVAVQAFQEGRAPVAIRTMGSDAWFTILVFTAIPGVLWHNLAALAFPPMQLVLPGYITPVFNVVLLLIVRELRQRRGAGARA